MCVDQKTWHQQSIQATDKAEEQRLQQRLASKACENHETQRMVAAALEGTFFNVMQVRQTVLPRTLLKPELVRIIDFRYLRLLCGSYLTSKAYHVLRR